MIDLSEHPGFCAIDLFAGGGGASLAMNWGLGVSPALAVNHDPSAIQMHARNHPESHHAEASVWEVSPRRSMRGREVDLLWLSPDCRHFSKAKGGAKVSPRVRSLARVAIPWAKTVRPKVICLENVEEFQTWGPLVDGKPDPTRAGTYFQKFVRDLERQSYQVDWKILNAADYGAPTSRQRLFMVARSDGLAPRWPEPTHGPGRDLPWRSAAECIDWSVPVLSIMASPQEAKEFAKRHGVGVPRRPLEENTQRRVAEGFVRFVLNQESRMTPAVEGWVSKFYGTSVGHSLSEPLSTISAQGQHHALCVPMAAGGRPAAWLAKHYTGVVGQQLSLPLGTITAVDHHSLCLARSGGASPERLIAWIERYYSSGGHSSSIEKPLPTITTVDRMSLVVAKIRESGIVDIGMRMLTPRELATAQGFPASYILTGSKRNQVARIGNSVSPYPAAALLRVNFEMYEPLLLAA